MSLGNNAAGPALLDGRDPSANSRLGKAQLGSGVGYVPYCRDDMIGRLTPIFNLSHEILFYEARRLPQNEITSNPH